LVTDVTEKILLLLQIILLKMIMKTMSLATKMVCIRFGLAFDLHLQLLFEEVSNIGHFGNGAKNQRNTTACWMFIIVQ